MPPDKPKPPPRPDPRRASRARMSELDERRSKPMIDLPLDERRAAFVRAYVKGEPLPSEAPSDPPAESDPPDDDDDVETSAPPRGRIVEVPPDMTIRPRRTVYQKVKDANKTVVAMGAVIAATIAAMRPLYSLGEGAFKWFDGVNQSVAAAKACDSAMKESAKVEREAIERLRADVADAGAAFGKTWDQQDEINLSVYRQLNRMRPQTPPPGLGPKAKAVGQ